MNATAAGAPAPHTERQPAGLPLRLAAMAYEGALLFGVLFVVSYAVLALAHWTYPLAGAQRLVLQLILFVTLGAYFVYQWHKTGQTLAMKSWQLRVVDAEGNPPAVAQAIGRYFAAWHLFLPGAAYAALFGGDVMLDLLAVAVGVLALMLPGAFDPGRRLLHDRLSRTYVMRERRAP